MPLVQASLLGEIPPGAIKEFEDSTGVYAICNVNGTIHCVDGVCPHAEGPLAMGALHGTTLVCPWHGWEFDVRTGDPTDGGDCKLRTYPAMIKDGRVFIETP